MNKLAILGASGHGKVIAEIAYLNGYNKIDFFDDRYPKLSSIEAWSVVGNTSSLIYLLGDYSGIIIAIGDNDTRVKKQAQLEAPRW